MFTIELECGSRTVRIAVHRGYQARVVTFYDRSTLNWPVALYVCRPGSPEVEVYVESPGGTEGDAMNIGFTQGRRHIDGLFESPTAAGADACP